MLELLIAQLLDKRLELAEISNWLALDLDLYLID